MSDSSSGESSDDDILSSPVFKKRDRRTERAAKSKLSFLDACLQGTNARTDAQRRLATVESEHILETEEQNELGKGGEKESSPQAQANDAAGDAIDTNKETADNDNDSDNSGSEKRNKIVRAPKTHHNEDAYWDRVESFNNTNRAKICLGIDSDRGKLSDAMNGLEYTSETDDEGGKWNDGVSGMARDQLRREASAKLQGLSASMGSRRMFRRTNSTTNKTCVYDSKLEAINELKSIVSTLQKRYGNEKGESEVILRCKLLDPLNKIFKKPKDLHWDLLRLLLQRNQLVTGACEEKVILPKFICLWMFKVACSSYEVMGHVSTACRQNLVKMIANEMDVLDGTFSADLTFVERLSHTVLVSHLENECGLWLHPGPVPSDDENIDDGAGKDTSSLDVYALKNLFILWKALLDRDLIKLDDGDVGANFFRGATKAVVALTRVSIDPTFILANENINHCISTLPSDLQSLIAALINSTIRRLSKLHIDSDAKKWIEHTADRMVEACSNLSAGDEGAADHDDDSGWLPLACAAERMIDFEFGDEAPSLDVIEMKLNFATLALKRCLAEDDISDSENKKLKEATARFKNVFIRNDSNDASNRMLQIAIHALTYAEISLQYIDDNSDAFMRDHPHLLASVLLCGECAFIGLHISKHIQECSFQLETEVKDTIVVSMSKIVTTCEKIKKKCTSVITHPHLRRTKEYLTRLGKAIGGMKGKASNDKRRKDRQQGSLDGWRRTSFPPSEDIQFSQDSNCSSQGLFLESQD